ncbi:MULTISPECIES: hypothetical protein [Myxococcus]|uniref:Polymerase nucleotidyl transferase domain-containing protein n=1 Tax=Myxococcus llanfairpwllgwyngyllgogerychwyrndrobwllllantysiliogogogochensis TaxID=2590453 RepID=A0A540X5G5_9BACT|nr:MULTISPECIES: hypothetical protein [Myxococcus]NTX05877.1 hypothetical protein [Myxococcus sp. CA040A]TQF16452.1 hypothetical protein FJV41_08190 [Myxococcus llanfairpwllgwyngyllgogerychwyrndrobwllllantysiliogogogochensis]
MTQPSRDELMNLLGVDLGHLLALESLTPAIEAAVFLSGSLVEGMGNAFSDIDVFVVGGGEPTGTSLHKAGDALFSVHMLGKRRVDFEYWSEASVEVLAAKLAALDLKEGGRDNVMMERRMTEDEIVFLHRVRTGVALMHDGRLDRLRSRFDFRRLSRWLLEVKIREVDDALEDLYGMMEQPDVALMRARELLNSTCDAFCHYRGSTNIRRKWRTRILGQLVASGDEEARKFEQRFWELQFPDGARLRQRPEDLKAYLETCIRLCNQLTDVIEE